MDAPQRAQEFIRKWRGVELKERAFAQEHFIDLCHLLNHPTPAEVDKTGESFTFEKGVKKTGGGRGFADVWKREFFGWEYKGHHKDFDSAYNQLLRYYEHLEQPPLLIVSDAVEFEIHTKFNNAVPKTYRFGIEQLDQPSVLGLLEAAFHDPQKLHPKERPDKLTEKAAQRFAELAESLRKRHAPRMVAHFLTQVVFTLFAEDIGLLPRGKSQERIFTEALRANQGDRWRHFPTYTADLFRAMGTGGDLQYQEIAHFNGGLFDGTDAWVPELTVAELETLLGAAELDWSAVEPSIFGTLFERGLAPEKRSQLGAHYTSKEDIITIVEPVLMMPLRRTWNQIQHMVTSPDPFEWPRGWLERMHESEAERIAVLSEVRDGFLNELASLKVLDPACGSGNFLYVSLNLLKDLEKEVINFPTFADLPPAEPKVSPAQLYGIEISEYAHELASVVVWIGFIQWHRNNGYPYLHRPILQRLSNIENKDAILGIRDDGTLYKPEWPKVAVIIGNPPFIKGSQLRQELGDSIMESIHSLYADLPDTCDLACYWVESARQQIQGQNASRAGFLIPQAISGDVNRAVLEKIKSTGDLFFAISDQHWVQDGIEVHVSMIGFDNGREQYRVLNNQVRRAINTDLTAGLDFNRAKVLSDG